MVGIASWRKDSYEHQTTEIDEIGLLFQISNSYNVILENLSGQHEKALYTRMLKRLSQQFNWY